MKKLQVGTVLNEGTISSFYVFDGQGKGTKLNISTFEEAKEHYKSLVHKHKQSGYVALGVDIDTKDLPHSHDLIYNEDVLLNGTNTFLYAHNVIANEVHNRNTEYNQFILELMEV